MSDVTYAIVFSGEIVEGFQPISVKAHLAKMLKASPEKMQVLFSGKPVVLKRTQDKAVAAKYGGALKKVGANVRVKIIKAAPTEPVSQPSAEKVATASQAQAAANTEAVEREPAPPSTTVAAPTNTDPDFSLAPNSGNLFEPAPEPESPDIDLSGISVAENDGSPLVAPKSYEQADIDLSAFSVADNDGSPLVAPDVKEVPKVDAPDFGLDAPGAVLETLKEEVEEVNPDTSSMSLAFPGSDLLSPEEKDQGPPPEAPDTSKLSIVRERAVF